MKRIILWLVIASVIALTAPAVVGAQDATAIIQTDVGFVIHYPSSWQATVFSGNANLTFDSYQLVMYYGQKGTFTPPTPDVIGNPFTMLGQTIFPQLAFNSVDALNARTPTGLHYYVESGVLYFDATVIALNNLPIPPDVQAQVQTVLANITQGSNAVTPPTAIPTIVRSEVPIGIPTPVNSDAPIGIPTPIPTQVPATSDYHVEYFKADRTTIPDGGCIVLSYWAVGAKQVTLHGSNWPGGPETILDNPNQRTVCPSAAGRYVPGEPITYTLAVTYLDGRTESRDVVITFDTAQSGGTSNYHIEYFHADRTSIPAGGCVVLSYWVVGATHITLQGSNWSSGPQVITDNPNQQTLCPSAADKFVAGQPVTYTLTVTYLDNRSESQSVEIRVGL